MLSSEMFVRMWIVNHFGCIPPAVVRPSARNDDVIYSSHLWNDGVVPSFRSLTYSSSKKHSQSAQEPWLHLQGLDVFHQVVLVYSSLSYSCHFPFPL